MPAHRPSSSSRIGTFFILAVLACLAVAATGSAATRYAGVGGSGVSPCLLATPCPIATAISGAAVNDTVHVLPGTHVVATTLFTPNLASNVTIEGEGIGTSIISYQPPAPTTNSALLVNGATPKLRELTILGSANASRLLAGDGFNTAPTVDRVALRNSGTGEALLAFGGATVRDSIITAAGTVPAAVLDGTMTGTTVVGGSGPAVQVNGDFVGDFSANGTIRNSILSGGSSDISVRTEGTTQSAHLDVDYSAYRQTGGIATSGNGTETTTVGTHNVFATPLLVNLAGGADVHQQAGSPTIDAGDPAAAAGSTGDIDGQPRIIGSAPDIGADEALTKPVAAIGAATNVTTTGATLNGAINPAGLATTYRFEYGPTTAYGSVSPDVTVPNGFTNVTATFDVIGLVAGSTIHARLVATNSAGTSASADATITLASPPATAPPPSPPEDAVPSIGPLSLVPSSPRSGRAATLRFTLSERARVTLTIDRLAAGRKRGTTCRIGPTTGARCTKVIGRAALARIVAAATASSFPIPAKPGGTKLLPGRYRVRLTARDLVTNMVSAARTLVIVVRA